ncbi:HAMP domain-containing histidine kinase [Roseospira marina]|uniref:HAMP domain-containing histidine kinase n=1 Tax=Roseospira marina TaxID=140057 RepID=A0A5M6ICJ2_9PROT|nr:HAMP domain-containing histidine kinase [Roseospira marina]KAA5605842.1 HAMP domain-containing histidine kinase [Roseospira marina]MBB4313661.1 signal transduction histidine kinase [Roseospira marina]MBB5086823.1 signal transduction histidine kinase [Roseospira marina]
MTWTGPESSEPETAAPPRRRPRPRPALAVLTLALIVAALLAGPTTLTVWRIDEARQNPTRMQTAHDTARQDAEIARAVEGLRGLLRQIRVAPPGAAGTEARRVALSRLRVLASDPMWRADLPPAFGAALDDAVAVAGRLSDQAAAQRPWAAEIASALAQLAPFTAGDGPRAKALTALHDVLAEAAEANAAALPLLAAEAHRHAAHAIAAPPSTTVVRGDPFAVHRAIEAALDIPAARRAALADRAARATLWQTGDSDLAEASDLAMTHAARVLETSRDALGGTMTRLTAALVSLGLAALAAGLVVAWRAVVGHALPLGRLARRGIALGYDPRRSGTGIDAAWDSLERLVGAMEDSAAVAQSARDAESNARRDATTLSAALLGAAPEAAVGRNLTGVARTLNTTLDAVRSQATLALTESRLLATAAGGRRADVSSERAALAAHLVGEACTTLSARVDEAAHLVSALRLLSAPVAEGPTRAPVALERILRETVSVLGPRLASRNIGLDLQCPSNATIEAPPGILTAVLCYVVEAAMLRAEDPPREKEGRGNGLSGIVMGVVLGSDARARLTIDDDGPAPSPETWALVQRTRGTDATEPGEWQGIHRNPERLAHALRRAPDAAALLLADGLARVALGAPLEIQEGPGRGTRVELSLPLQAAGDDRDPSNGPSGRSDPDGPGGDPDLPLLRAGITRG